MNLIELKLEDSLRRINFIFKNEEIHTECIKDFQSFTVLEEIIGPFEHGKKYKIKLFLAKILIKHNILKIATTEKCDNIDLQRFALAERDSDKIIKREQNYFFNRLKEFRQFMEKEVKDGLKPQIFLDNYNAYFKNLLDSRVLKILRMSRSILTLDDERRLSESELLIYKYINESLNYWVNFFMDSK